MSSKLFKVSNIKAHRLPLDATTSSLKAEAYVKANKTALKNPGKAKFSESLNNYNAVRDKVVHEMRVVRQTPEPPTNKKVSIGLK
jgi:hypothetical protein